MRTVIVIGIAFVHLALIFYILFIIQEHKKRKAAKSVLSLITIAVLFDIIATACMMAGTTRTYFTFHGIIGYIGLLLMLTDAVLLWKHKIKEGAEVLLSRGLHLYSKIAFSWWMIAFITGVVVTMTRR